MNTLSRQILSVIDSVSNEGFASCLRHMYAVRLINIIYLWIEFCANIEKPKYEIYDEIKM